jgi:hypothetical protein
VYLKIEMAVSETVNSKQEETLRFFSREREIAQLKEIQSLSLKNAQFTVVTGRRRIGKTHFLLNATENQPTLYFFVARKAES